MHKRTRIVWTEEERQAIVQEAVSIDPQGHGLRLTIFNQAMEQAIAKGRLDKARRRHIQGIGGNPQMTWFPEGVEREKERRRLLAQARAQAEQVGEPGIMPMPAGPAIREVPVEGLPEPAVAFPPQARPETATAPAAAPEPATAGPSRAGNGQYLPGASQTAMDLLRSMMGGLDAVPLPELLASVGRRVLGLVGPEDPSIKQQLQVIALQLARIDHRLRTVETRLGLEQPEPKPAPTQMANLKLGGREVPVRVAPEGPKVIPVPPQPPPEPDDEEPHRPAPKPAPKRPEVKHEPRPEPPPKAKIVLAITHSGNVNNHIKSVCSQWADLTFLNKTPSTVAAVKDYDLIVLTKWCDKGFVKDVEATLDKSKYVYLSGNANHIAEQLKLGLMQLYDQYTN